MWENKKKDQKDVDDVKDATSENLKRDQRPNLI
jgi:hypothetical protein